MIKMVTIDLDGTLFDNHKVISKENKEALAKAREKGCYIVLATGRPYDGVKATLDELNLNTENDYVITYNGGKILNAKTKEVIFSSTIDGIFVKELYKEALKQNVDIHAFRANEELITPKHNPYTDVEATINHITDNLFDFNNILDSDLFIKAMLVSSDENVTRITPIYKEYYDGKYQVLRSAKIFLEFLNKDTNKGKALEYLASYLNIKLSETMAIGDADNDISMIKTSGVGVAMANSFKEVLDVADFVTKSNLESGVAYAIEKFVL